MMAAAVSETLVEDGYVKASFGGIELFINEQNGFVNGTRLCAQCNVNGKHTGSFNGSSGRKHRKAKLSVYYGEMSNSLARTAKHDPCLFGMYYHPALLLDLANWLSPQTYVAAAIIIDAYFNKTEKRKRLLSELFDCNETATYENEPPNCRILYEGFELVVNERGWFKTSRDATAKTRSFEADKATLEYFRANGLYSARGTYHPLLFLRLAAGMDAKMYVRSARVILCCAEMRLQALIRREIAAAGATLDVPVATSDRSTNGVLAELTAASTSAVAAPGVTSTSIRSVADKIFMLAPTRSTLDDERPASTSSAGPDWSDFVLNEDSNMTMDTIAETDSMLTREEHEMELARVRRQLELERCEKEVVLAKLRIKDDQLEELRRRLENMQIGDSPRESRKRSCRESLANAPTTKVNDVRVVECLVLFVSTENKVYGYRRKLRSIIQAIHEQRHKVAKFIGWFITNNAVVDYNRVVEEVRDQAKECGRVVRRWRNEVQLDDEGGADFDLPKSIRKTLRIDMEVIEAGIRLLGRLFDKPTYHEENPAAEPQTSTFLDRVHRWVEDEHARFMSRRQ